MTEQTQQTSVSLGAYADHVSEALGKLEHERTVERLWAGDHTLWSDDPTEITDRLGWLHVIGEMQPRVPELQAFADEIRKAGLRHVVLLGMGGSSLGPEVLRLALGGVESHPELIVLDSTAPTWVHSVASQAKPDSTLYIVSSKSGGTIEPNSLYKYFRRTAERTLGHTKAGAHFVAITDPGTSLEKMASDQGFRRTFLNRPDIGGRYSVLSYFGLVPSALAGVDIGRVLDDAAAMAAKCGGQVRVADNPGAWLGAFMAATAMNGRDKLTLFTSPSVTGFGLWAEQLIAESTGKNGKGIIPVTGEPVLAPDAYGDDRAFVYLRREGDENATFDVATERLAAQGHPVVRLDMPDKYRLGGEFFRWEFATAIVGALLGIHPFDQPDVQAAKDATNQVLADYNRTGVLPLAAPERSLAKILDEAAPGKYAALMVYAQPTEGVESILTELRKHIMEQHKVATTVGYGPRFLHSTGQLHKGGPNTGLFVQFTAQTDRDVPIPGENYSFGTLLSAQAVGDFRALQQAGRRVVRIDLGKDAESGLLRLLATL
jgi:glucose-6-phosphate isomerase